VAKTRSRKASPTRKTPARKASRRKPARRWGAGLWLRLPVFEQRELDLIGLFLVAINVFLTCILYIN
jgi:hypothetical protein